MSDKLIDFHTHTQPSISEGIAFQQQFGYETPERNGTVAELLPMMRQTNTTKTLIVPWMPAQDHADRLSRLMSPGNGDEITLTKAKNQVARSWIALNQWAVDVVATCQEQFMCLVGLDPILMGEDLVRKEVADKLSKGAVGLKIAPMFLRVPPNDNRMAIIYELARQHGVWVLAQSGGHGFKGSPAWGHPVHFDEVLKAFPTVDFMLAHLGIGAEDSVAKLTAKYPNLYTDCSSRLHLFGTTGHWSLNEAANWFRRIGVDRIVYGTNYPLNDPLLYREIIHRMPITSSERSQICFENAEGILQRSNTR